MLKKITLVLLSLLIFTACSDNPVSDNPDPNPGPILGSVNLSGTWRGQFTVEFPGADGWPVAQTALAVVTFGEREFSYTLTLPPDDLSDQDNSPFGKVQTPVIPGGQGIYNFPQKGQVSFGGLSVSSGTNAAFRLEGIFQYRLENQTLVLRQELSEPFEITRELVLTNGR